MWTTRAPCTASKRRQRHVQNILKLISRGKAKKALALAKAVLCKSNGAPHAPTRSGACGF
jgi:hypothetical protein